MNYKKHYENLIIKALGRKVNGDEYLEKHHIQPKCLGGNNRKTNIVKLSPREHYVAHQLLVKIHPAHNGLKYALYKMTLNTTKTERTNIQYSWVKKQLSIANKKLAAERWKDNQREKDIYSERTKNQWKNMSDDVYAEACDIRSVNQTGKSNSFYGKVHCDSAKDIMSTTRSEYFAKMSDSDRLEKIKQIKQVSICGIIYAGLSFAARNIGISPSLLHYRLNSKSVKWKDYIYID